MAAYKASSGEGLAPCLQLLQQAARDKSVKPELVEGALAYLEQQHGETSREGGRRKRGAMCEEDGAL